MWPCITWSSVLLLSLSLWAQSPDLGNGEPAAGEAAATSFGAPASESAFIAPLPSSRPQPPERGVDWGSLAKETFLFLNLQHSFRLATEPGTREGMRGSFLRGWGRSANALHGWADGDPFYVNYIGHPMQGSVSAYLFAQNDRAYRDVAFGRDPRYWKSRLRATAFSFAYSTQFEIGPYSEATIGKIQSRWPQYGLVDLVVTPVIGMGWMVAEDALDELLVRRIEHWTTNNWVRLFARSGLNPTRTVANTLRGRVPWHRDNRNGVYAPYSFAARPAFIDPPAEAAPPDGVAPFEFSMSFSPVFYGGGTGCYGGTGNAAFRLSAEWQFVVDVGGCNLSGLPRNMTGDALTYLAGPRWKAAGSRRVSPHVQFLVGGQRVVSERFHPESWQAMAAMVREAPRPYQLRDQYVEREQSHALALAAGGGIDVKLHEALALRLANLEYRRAWTAPVAGQHLNTGLQLTTGLVLRMGTW